MDYDDIEQKVLERLKPDVLDYAMKRFKTVDGYTKTNLQYWIELQIEYCNMYNEKLKIDDIIQGLQDGLDLHDEGY